MSQIIKNINSKVLLFGSYSKQNKLCKVKIGNLSKMFQINHIKINLRIRNLSLFRLGDNLN